MLDLNKARNLCLPMVQSFYENLQNLYIQRQYQPTNIWNVDESGANTSRNGVGKVFGARGCRNVHTITLNEREWISVVTIINTNANFISNYYIFKGVRFTRDYLTLYEDGATFGMQKKDWIDAYQIEKWMDYFTLQLRSKIDLFTTSTHLLILDSHKAHLTLEVVQKAKRNGIHMITLLSHTSYG